jgi:hypothetical protein
MNRPLFPPVMEMLFEYPFPIIPMEFREEVTTLLRSTLQGRYASGVTFTMTENSIVVNFMRLLRETLVQIPMWFSWSSPTKPTVREAMEAILLFTTMEPCKVFNVAGSLVPSTMKPPGTAWMVTHPLINPLIHFYSQSLGRVVVVHHQDDPEAQECLEYLVKLWTAPKTTLSKRLRKDERALGVVNRAKELLHGMASIRTDGSFYVRPHVLVLVVAMLALHVKGLMNVATVLFQRMEGDMVIQHDQGEDIRIPVTWGDLPKTDDQSRAVISGVSIFENGLEQTRQLRLSQPPPPLPVE